MAKPLELTEELAATICGRLADGKSLRKICKMPGMPSTATVCKWLGTVPTFAEQYARARELQADAFVDEITDICDDMNLDPAHKRVMVDTRKWVASKMRPKKYGERTDLAVSGTLTLESLVVGSLQPDAIKE